MSENQKLEQAIMLIEDALGPQLMELIHTPGVTEIMANPDGQVWIEDHKRGMWASELHLEESARDAIIRALASLSDDIIDENTPEVAAVLPGIEARFQGLIPPAVSAPAFTIRIPSVQAYSLVDYTKEGILEHAQLERLAYAIKHRQNIIVAGGTGSGKTTLANALLQSIANGPHRIMIIEDTPELKCTSPNTLAVRVNRQTNFDYAKALFVALRMRPDRIIVGELRDGKATLQLLKAWNTGHGGGLATVHANNARASLIRVEQLLEEEVARPPKALIAEAVQVVVYIERYNLPSGEVRRRVRDVMSVSSELKAGQEYDVSSILHNSVDGKLGRDEFGH